MNLHTLKRLSQVHPILRQRVEILIARLAAQGVTVEAVQGLRTAQEQNDLYAKGRTKPGPKVTNAKAWQSNHCYGLAVDLCPFVNGKPDWNAPRKVWDSIGTEAERLHLEWGGRWKFRDLPHVQLQGLSIAQCYELSRGGSLKPVWDAASRIVLAVSAPSSVPKVEKGTTVYPAPQKSSGGPFPAQESVSPYSTTSDFPPRSPAFVPAQSPKQAAESLKSGNTLPVSLVTIQAACELFFRENGFKLLLWLTLSILIALVIYEFGPKLKRMVKL